MKHLGWLVAIHAVALLPAAESPAWELAVARAAGAQADGRHLEAERLYRSASELARHTAPDSPQIPAILNHLGAQ